MAKDGKFLSLCLLGLSPRHTTYVRLGTIFAGEGEKDCDIHLSVLFNLMRCLDFGQLSIADRNNGVLRGFCTFHLF